MTALTVAATATDAPPWAPASSSCRCAAPPPWPSRPPPCSSQPGAVDPGRRGRAATPASTSGRVPTTTGGAAMLDTAIGEPCAGPGAVGEAGRPSSTDLPALPPAAGARRRSRCGWAARAGPPSAGPPAWPTAGSRCSSPPDEYAAALSSSSTGTTERPGAIPDGLVTAGHGLFVHVGGHRGVAAEGTALDVLPLRPPRRRPSSATWWPARPTTGRAGRGATRAAGADTWRSWWPTTGAIDQFAALAGALAGRGPGVNTRAPSIGGPDERSQQVEVR